MTLYNCKLLLNSTTCLPINGLDEVIGMISDTVIRKIVRDSRIVTPENINLMF